VFDYYDYVGIVQLIMNDLKRKVKCLEISRSFELKCDLFLMAYIN